MHEWLDITERKDDVFLCLTKFEMLTFSQGWLLLVCENMCIIYGQFEREWNCGSIHGGELWCFH